MSIQVTVMSNGNTDFVNELLAKEGFEEREVFMFDKTMRRFGMRRWPVIALSIRRVSRPERRRRAWLRRIPCNLDEG